MLKFVVNLLFPAVCVICGEDDVHLCQKCLGAVGRRIRVERYEGEVLDGVISCCFYQDGGVIAKVIHCFKYEFIRELAGVLGGMLVEGLGEGGLGDVTLCPVPLHRKRERWRGFNQSKLLVDEMGGGCELLRRVSFKKPQMELGRDERVLNVREAFVVLEGIDVDKSRPVILVDDVCTTGATLRECAKALKEAGFRLVYGLVIAQT